MSVKLAFAFLLTASVACFGQVTVMGGYATTSGPSITTIPGSAANPPLVSTPDVALPGSGPAVGVPLSNTNTNDSRASTGPSIANSNSITLTTETNGGVSEAPVASSSVAPSANSGPFEFGIQRFGLETAPASTATSLGEIAKRYRLQHHQPVRTFTNDNIARLIAVAFQPGPLSTAAKNQTAFNLSEPGARTNLTSPTVLSQAIFVDQLTSEDRAPDLSQSDQDTAGPRVVEVALHSDATAAQQRHAGDDQATSDQRATESAATPASNLAPRAGAPQTRSSLPLFLLIGGLGIAARALFLIFR